MLTLAWRWQLLTGRKEAKDLSVYLRKGDEGFLAFEEREQAWTACFGNSERGF